MPEKESYNPLENELAHFTRAIGHPARVAVLLAIANKGGEVDGEFLDIPQLSPTTVIQHLRELKRSGLIKGRIFGARARFSIDYDKLREFDVVFRSFFAEVRPKDTAKQKD